MWEAWNPRDVAKRAASGADYFNEALERYVRYGDDNIRDLEQSLIDYYDNPLTPAKLNRDRVRRAINAMIDGFREDNPSDVCFGGYDKRVEHATKLMALRDGTPVIERHGNRFYLSAKLSTEGLNRIYQQMVSIVPPSKKDALDEVFETELKRLYADTSQTS